MRTGTLLLARVSVMGLLTLVLGSCAGRTLHDQPLIPVNEQPIFVELPPSVIRGVNKDKYDNNFPIRSRIEKRCTYQPLPAGTACNSSVEVRIIVIEGAKFVKAVGNVRHPHLIAWIENTGTKPTFDGIRPGKQAVVAVAKGAGTALTLVQFARMSGTSDYSVQSWEYGIVKECDPFYLDPNSDMSFRGCHRKAATGPADNERRILATSQVRLSSMWSENSAEPPANAESLDDPLWLRCSPGCCTS